MAQKTPQTITINDKDYTEDQLTDEQKMLIKPCKQITRQQRNDQL
jgi:hypothetical protein